MAQTYNYILNLKHAPGDSVVLTAAVRDLKRKYPDYQIKPDTTAPEIWHHNPYINPHLSVHRKNTKLIDVDYQTLLKTVKSNPSPRHYLEAMITDLNHKLNLDIELTKFKPDIHLSEEEKTDPPALKKFNLESGYWLMLCGGKDDFTVKWWYPPYAQEVVDYYKDQIKFVQVGKTGYSNGNNHQWRLNNTIDLIDQTSIRELIQLVYHSAGVVCSVTMLMHLSAALPFENGTVRPCVVIAGGRELPNWYQYPGHQALHTIGSLPCCSNTGCWRALTEYLPYSSDRNQENLICERPSHKSELTIPKCMDKITPSKVIESIDTYL